MQRRSIDRKTFCDMLCAIKIQLDRDEKFSNMLSELSQSHIAFTSPCIADTVRILDEALKPYQGDMEWVDHWVFEKEFGKRVDLEVSCNGKVYDLKTPGELYDFITMKGRLNKWEQ